MLKIFSKNIYLNTFKTLLGLSVASFFFVFGHYALATAWDIDFESYDIGPVNGQDDWVWYWPATSTFISIVDEGDNKLVRATNSPESDYDHTYTSVYRSDSAFRIATGTLCIDFRGNYYAHHAITFSDGGSSKYWSYLIYNNDGYIDIHDGNEWLPVSYTYNVWHTLCTTWDPTADTYNTWIDGTLMSSNLDMIDAGGNFNGVSKVDIRIIPVAEIYSEMDFDNLRITTELEVANPGANQGFTDYLSGVCPDIIAYDQTFFMGEDAKVEYYYNDLLVDYGGYVELVDTLNPFYVLESETPAITSGMRSTNLVLDWATYGDFIATGTTWHLCFYVHLATSAPGCFYGISEFLDCEYEYTWVDREQYEAEWRKQMDEIWAEYASTSEMTEICDNLCEEEENFISCGLKRFGCWAVFPSNATLQHFFDNYYALFDNFPVNIIYQIKDSFSTSTLATTTATSIKVNLSTIGLPSDTDFVIASTTMMGSTFGNLWTNYIYKGMEDLIYFSFFIFILVFIIKIGTFKDISNIVSGKD